jgi:RimJ/RimL family protein N-acetyltransferase
MELSTQLFESPNLILDFYDPEKDASDETRFTYDLNYAWAIDIDGSAHPLTCFEVKKKREAQLKKSDESKAEYYFAIRRKGDEKFLGVVAVPWVSWKNRNAGMRVLIGNVDENKTYIVEALNMALRYLFEGLEIHSVDIFTGDFQPEMMEACRESGMAECVRQREMVYRNGQLWDRVIMSMQQEKWIKLHNEV